MNMQENLCDWFEIPVTDTARAKDFYEKSLDIKMQTHEMGPAEMVWFPAPESGKIGATGTLIKADGYEPSLNGSIVYLYVRDIEDTLQRINSNGGKTLNPKMSIGEHGFVAHFQDSEGNRVALHSDK